VASEGPFPWTPSVVPTDAPTSVPPPPPGTSTLPPAAPTVADSKGGLTPVAGDQPGLYGGSNELGVCDKEELISFLENNTDKRAAFVGVLDISDVGQYIESLTPVILTGDARVTNHGFENGRATPFQSVLQAGTAVLVDDRGVPRVRCACGNPLAPAALATSKPNYTGDSWPGFDPGRIIVIQPTPAPITQLNIINISNGTPLVIPVMPQPPSGSEPPLDASGTYRLTATQISGRCTGSGWELVLTVSGRDVLISIPTSPDPIPIATTLQADNTFSGKSEQYYLDLWEARGRFVRSGPRVLIQDGFLIRNVVDPYPDPFQCEWTFVGERAG
jgi:hypothetical protein